MSSIFKLNEVILLFLTNVIFVFFHFPLQIKLNESSPKNYLGWLSTNKAGVCSTASNGPPQLGGHALVGDLGLLSMADGVKDLNDSQTCFTHLNDLNTNPNLN